MRICFEGGAGEVFPSGDGAAVLAFRLTAGGGSTRGGRRWLSSAVFNASSSGLKPPTKVLSWPACLRAPGGSGSNFSVGFLPARASASKLSTRSYRLGGVGSGLLMMARVNPLEKGRKRGSLRPGESGRVGKKILET